MRDKAILGLMILLAGMGVLVDFTSAILSVVSDMLMMGAAVACAIIVFRSQQARITDLEAKIASLQAPTRNTRLGALHFGAKELSQP